MASTFNMFFLGRRVVDGEKSRGTKIGDFEGWGTLSSCFGNTTPALLSKFNWNLTDVYVFYFRCLSLSINSYLTVCCLGPLDIMLVFNYIFTQYSPKRYYWSYSAMFFLINDPAKSLWPRGMGRRSWDIWRNKPDDNRKQRHKVCMSSYLVIYVTLSTEVL